MAYQIICLKNRAFWNKVVLFVAFFVLAVYCISLVMPDVKKDLATDDALYQEIQQELDADEQSAQQKKQST